ALVTRMYLQGRPPVTNLYSSAIFVGWVAVLMGLGIEWFLKNGFGTIMASITGFCALLVAHNLGTDGDTMEMMRAVLDTNFWLATHVTTITMGYAASFLAGFMGLLVVLMGVLSKRLSKDLYHKISGMIYGTIAFATLFSFVGTVLGGIWADQSWGRFWGWDPKENGAVMIVLWNAIILHARWGGLAKKRGIALLAIGGNIVTAWSWFGVNMLGVGLHSYGFTDKAFMGLAGFVLLNILVICLGSLPEEHWRSFRPKARVQTPEVLEQS
ncbi:MAG: cytochrome C biogenesis protein, partial [Candidatus Melainabacteria bacterium HGW-Melainabacteria-1]